MCIVPDFNVSQEVVSLVHGHFQAFVLPNAKCSLTEVMYASAGFTVSLEVLPVDFKVESD